MRRSWMKTWTMAGALRLPDEVGKEARTKQRGGGGRGRMNPLSILTGLRGQMGEVVRWTV
jgi:hypothetical protein